MKALSLWQPYASLVAEGIKRVETRNWSTRYRGPLAIASTAYTTARHGTGQLGDVWWMSDRHGCLLRTTGGTDPHADKVIGEGPHGHVLATCTLVDVVPAEDAYWTGLWSRWAWQRGGSPVYPQPDLDVRDLPVVLPARERAFGDFAPGRFIWLLDGAVRLDPPVLVKGRQGLWEWIPSAQGDGRRTPLPNAILGG